MTTANLVCEARDPMPYTVGNAGHGTRIPRFDWASCAVLARTRAALQRVRAVCEHFQIPVVRGLDAQRPPRLHRVREIARLPVADAIEFLYEALAEQRMEARIGRGVFLATAHAAKGMEFDHVLIPGSGWSRSSTVERQEEERRLFYVAMTRARQTLTMIATAGHPHVRLIRGEGVFERTGVGSSEIPAEILDRRYEMLGLADLDLGFAGSHFHRHPIHAALEQLEPGSRLQLEVRTGQIVLTDPLGRVVARLSQAACAKWQDRLDTVLEARVVAMLRRYRTDHHPDYRDRSRCDHWEVPLVELITSADETTQGAASRCGH